MQSKSLLIAVAAFAVTTTGAQAYGGAILQRANLTDDQRTALEQAKELRQSGDTEAARDVLVEAGIDEDVLAELRAAARETRAAIKTAVETGDYDEFQDLITDTPLQDIITTPADFESFREAHNLRQDGEYEEARAILNDLGIDRPERGGKFLKRHIATQLTDEQREALRVAKQANDRETVQAILAEAGIERR